jgi:calcineurin-like phosphoesterase family protein
MAEFDWVVSDTHFYHENILKFTDDLGNPIRPFKTIQEMHDCFVDNWNSCVRDGDTVLHVGDVTWKHCPEFASIMGKLKGRKKLLIGNHDDPKKLAPYFSSLGLWRVFKNHGFVVSHVPVAPECFPHNVWVNVHGHTHEKSVRRPDGILDPRYMNVCVEKTGYRPKSIDEIIAAVAALRPSST